MVRCHSYGGGLGLAAVISGLMISCSGVALAQQSGAAAAGPVPADAGGLEEIIVTSRKVSEKLQSAPVTVSVVTGKTLQDLDIDRPEDLARLTPGFHYEETGARYFNKPTIRGLSVNSIEYANQKAQTFIDGIAFAGQFGSYPTDDGEYDRVEVLKGPQSTAFGRGTLSGGINYITKDPANYFSGIASAEYRTNDETHDYLFINVPIIEDILTSYLSVNYYSYGGPGGAEWHDAVNGEQLSNESSEDIAAKFKLTPNDWLTFKLRASYGFDDDGIPTFDFLADSQRNGSFQNGTIHLPVGPISVSANQVASPTYQMSNPGLRRETWRSEFNASADLGPVTLTSVTGLNRQNDRIEYGAEASGSPYFYYTAPVYLGTTGTYLPGEHDGEQDGTVEHYEDVQEELRMTSNGDGPLKYMVGFDYFNWRWREDYTGFGLASDERVASYAGFGQLSYAVTDELTVGAEARYNLDQITYEGIYYSEAQTNHANYYHFLPRITADYQFTPDIMLYAVVSEGNHPGTFNNPVFSASPALDKVREETLWNYEAGIKSEWFDHRLRVNLAGYHMEWNNQQLLVDAAYPCANGAGGGNGGTCYSEALTNAGKSHIDGMELEVDGKPTEYLNIRGTLAYDNAVFDEFCSPQYYGITGIGNAAQGCRSVAGKTLPQQPPLTMSLLVSYDAPLPMFDSWNYFLIGDWSYLDRKFADETDLTWTPVSNIFNFRAGVHNDQFRVEAFVVNATQETAPVRASTRQDYQFFVGGYTRGYYGAYDTDEVPQKPRQFGVKVTYNFGAPSAPQAAPAVYVPPPAVAPQAAPSVAHSYMVFFDFNKSDLTAQAVAIVGQAAKNAAPAKATQLVVTGHTDTVGSDAYNMRLSRRRAESVAAELEKQGIPSSEIELVAKGKHDLLVPTKDGVREPQNRRVTIVYGGGMS